MPDSDENSIVPNHVAVIMDGNGRWARRRRMPRTRGHHVAVARVRELIETSAKKGIKALTLFVFSSENWHRPRREVDILMGLLMESLNKEMDKLHQAQVSIRMIGARERLLPEVREAFNAAERLTQPNTGLKLTLAVNYGGRWDILEAAKKLARLVDTNDLDRVNESLFERLLSTGDLPAVDLLIRTSGEKRISNFLLWQCAYSELYFTDILFPDFDRETFEKALQWYQSRERRFGKTSEQVICQ